jgi:hypothetical protein
MQGYHSFDFRINAFGHASRSRLTSVSSTATRWSRSPRAAATSAASKRREMRCGQFREWPSQANMRTPHIAQHEKAAIESMQISATAGATPGNADSRRQPIFA